MVSPENVVFRVWLARKEVLALWDLQVRMASRVAQDHEETRDPQVTVV